MLRGADVPLDAPAAEGVREGTFGTARYVPDAAQAVGAIATLLRAAA